MQLIRRGVKPVVLVCALITAGLWGSAGIAQDTAALCPTSALERFTAHRVSAGETLESIAAEYGLLPAAIARANSSAIRPGQTLRIPPVNGITVSANGSTWQALAERYGVAADLIFEINGCPSSVPAQVFIPGTRWYSQQVTAAPTPARLPGYPLAAPAAQILSYGWQPHPERAELVFNSGIALAASSGADVLSVGDGTVAYADQQTGYGNLVVVNHRDGLQTRYANLEEISVSVGERVRSGNLLGRVGDNQANTGTFVYFEVRTYSQAGWVAQDPSTYVPALALD